MRKKARTINGVVVDCRYVEEGTRNIDGREVSWAAGSRVFIVVEGDREVSKFRVNPNAEKKVSAFFDDCPFGLYVALMLDADGLIMDAKAVTA